MRPAYTEDFNSNADKENLGAEFRAFRDQLVLALQNGNLEELLDSNSALKKLVEAARTKPNFMKDSVVQGAKNYIEFVDKFKSNIELGRKFQTGDHGVGLDDATLPGRIWNAVVFTIDDVNDYVEAMRDADHEFLVSEVGVQAPLFETVFFEYSLPPGSIFNKAGLLMENIGQNQFQKEKPNFGEQHPDRVFAFEDAKWIVKFTTVAQPKKGGPVIGPIFETYVPIDENGMLYPTPSDPKRGFVGAKNGTFLCENGIVPEDDIKRAESVNIEIVVSTLMANSFLNCTNIKWEEVDPNSESPKLANKRAKSGKRPYVKFNTLKIPKIEEATRIIREHLKAGSEIPIQIVRGHFKRYTADRPLFGDRVGQWWWMGHVRGTNNAGASLKDYRITNPRASVAPQDRNI